MDAFIKPRKGEESLVDITKLAEVQDNRDRAKLKYFNKVLADCSMKIQYTHGFKNETDCVFEIPKFTLDFPLYDISELAQYLTLELRKKDYTVEFVKPNILCISWYRKLKAIQKEKQIKMEIEKTEGKKPPFPVDPTSALSRAALRAKMIQKQKERGYH